MANEPLKDEQKKKVPTVSRMLADGSLVELVYEPKSQQTLLAVYAREKVTLHSQFDLENGENLAPLSARNNLIKHQVVLLPAKAETYGSVSSLLADIKTYVRRYVDLSDEFLEIASHYVLLTWVYDAFNELPYLRMRGDFGSGKTRALLVIGAICYKPFFASGASTVSPIFHTIDTFRGTLVFDEADFRFSDEKAELVKIFNNGNVRGFPVLRTAMNIKREFDPQAFAVYGPKIVAMRDAFQDAALESRFVTEEMGRRVMRKNIPINLPDAQKDEALTLRNKLLMYRFQEWHSTKINAAFVDASLSPRLNQILVPLLSISSTDGVRADIRRAASLLEQQVRRDRVAAPDIQLLEVLARLLVGAQGDRVPVAEITRLFIAECGDEFDRPITNRYVGSLLRKRLRITTFKSHGTYAVPITERTKVRELCERYGLAIGEELREKQSPSGHGDVGSST